MKLTSTKDCPAWVLSALLQFLAAGIYGHRFLERMSLRTASTSEASGSPRNSTAVGRKTRRGNREAVFAEEERNCRDC